MKEPFRQALEISPRSGPHVEDVRRLMAFHGLDHHEPGSLALIEAKLADSHAFRTDLSALARHISGVEQRTVTDDEMRTLIQSAAIGTQTADVPAGSSIRAYDPNLTTRLADTGATDPPFPPPQATPEPTPMPALGGVAEPSAAATETEAGGSQRRLELAVIELKLYLDDINRRIGRIEPHLEDISRIVRNAAERLQPAEDAMEPARAHQQSPLKAPEPPDTAPLLQIEPDLKHRGSPSPATVDSPLARAPAAPPNSPSPEESLSGTDKPGVRRTTATPIAYAHPRKNLRETAGNALAVVAVLLAIVGGIAAMYAFDKPAENATAEQAGAQGNQGGAPTANKARSAPGTPELIARQAVVESPPTPVRSQGKLERSRERETFAAQPKVPLPQPPPKLASPTAKVAGKRSEPLRQEPRIEVLPAVHVPPPTAIDKERSRRQDAASRTDAVDGGKLAGNSPPVGLASHGAGTPEVESHSSMQAALIASRKPVYPPEALSQHKEGTVVLDALIARDGSVKRMDVVEGSPGFTRSALNAVSWWRYKPSHARGEAAETQARITVNYRIH